jgi:RNA polymerase sigma factor (sigma-70 family)
MVSDRTVLVNCATSRELTRWHREFQRALVAALRKRSGSARFRDDALQELWTSVIRAPPSPEVADDSARLLAWLIGAARRRLSDHLRREKRRRQTLLIDLPDDTDAEREDEAQRVHAVLAAMSAGEDSRAAQLLELQFIEGQSVAAIARLLNVPPRAISARIQRAKGKFRQAWLAGGGSD